VCTGLNGSLDLVFAGETLGGLAPAESPWSPASTATTEPTGTVDPAGARISDSTPPAVAGISIDVLSVSISNKLSPGEITSPTALYQTMMVPSATVSPSWGIKMFIPEFRT
jgi:hypothetical protein